ncbi:MAG: hypothetical protein IT437_06380 [Phycisphaerales bacterium]|nr:hypothetical protein [Phycisphaerales bacterium]
MLDQMLIIRRTRRWPLVALVTVAVGLGMMIAMAGYLRVQDYLVARTPPTPSKFARAE